MYCTILELQRRKDKVRKFREAEQLDANNNITSGEYHRYSSEFINERAMYEIPHGPSAKRGILSWVKKSTVTDEAYRKFRDKYYDRIEYMGTVFEKDGSYRGRTELKTGYFVKSKYVETRETTLSGVDMRDERYVKLMNPTTDLGRAQKDFYELFNKEMKATLEKLPIDVQQKMLGKVG